MSNSTPLSPLTTLTRRGGCETTLILGICGAALQPYLTGYGVDFGCELDPVPGARVLVDAQKKTWDAFHESHEVHIRDINKGFEDWIADGRQFDFVYSSHLMEHLRDPHAFLHTCNAILKPGGHLILILPDEDLYWPNGHPNANPDHKWWHLNGDKVTKWVRAAFDAPGLDPVFRRDGDAPEGGRWSLVLVFRKPGEAPVRE